MFKYDNMTGKVMKDQLEGAAIDILDMLKEALHFDYSIHVSTDGTVGNLNRRTGKWSGAIGELWNKVRSARPRHLPGTSPTPPRYLPGTSPAPSPSHPPSPPRHLPGSPAFPLFPLPFPQVLYLRCYTSKVKSSRA